MALDHQQATPPAHIYYHTETKPAPTGQPNVSREKSPPVQQLRNDTQAQAMTVSERKTEPRQKAATPQTGWTKKDPSGKMPSYTAGTRSPYVKNHLQRKEKTGAGGGLVRPNWGKIKSQPKPVELVSIPKSTLTPNELVASIRQVLALANAMNTQTSMDDHNATHEEAQIAKYPTDAERATENLWELEAKYGDEIAKANISREKTNTAKDSENELWAQEIAEKNRLAEEKAKLVKTYELAKDFSLKNRFDFPSLNQ